MRRTISGLVNKKISLSKAGSMPVPKSSIGQFNNTQPKENKCQEVEPRKDNEILC